MDDTKTQDSRKTVVAFVAGLLIGGLLMWMFSGAPKTSSPSKIANEAKTSATSEQYTGATATEKTGTISVVENTGTTTVPTQSDFTFTVANQPTGMTVSLGNNVKYPMKEGWIAIQDEMNGKLGNALGAARYDTGVGLTPNSIELLRSTEVGKTYHVVYYTESGDKIFNRADDMPLTATGGGIVETTFVAQ
jgi:hypothetical protein